MNYADDIPFVIAFLGGMLSFLSPCVLPLVPGYLSYIAGIRIEDSTSQNPLIRYRLIISALLFVMGFGFVFMALGAGASLIAPLLSLYQPIFTKIAGGFIMLMGIHLLGIIKFEFLYREWRLNPDLQEAQSIITPLLLGMAFGLGWTPCIGPVLAGILVLASQQDNIIQGTILLGIYTLGLGIPFIVTAFFMQQFQQKSKFLKKHLGTIEKISGGLLCLTGGLIITSELQNLGHF